MNGITHFHIYFRLKVHFSFMFLLSKCMSRKVSSRLETPSGYLRYRLRNEFLSQVDFNRDFLLSKRMQWFSISLENSTHDEYFFSSEDAKEAFFALAVFALEQP